MPSWTTTRSWTSGETPTNEQFNQYLRDDLDIANRQFITLAVTGALTSGTKPGRWIAPYPFNITTIYATISDASTSGSVVFDVLRTTASSTSAAATLFSATSQTGITISSGNTESTSTPPAVTALSTGDIIQIALTTQTGSTSTANGQIIISGSGG